MSVESDDRLWKRQTNSGIPEHARFALWDTIDVDETNRLEVLKLRRWEPTHGSIWIEGEVGSGKTTLAATIANELLNQPFLMQEVIVKNGEIVEVAENGNFTPYRQRVSEAGTLQIRTSTSLNFKFIEEPQFYRQARAFQRFGPRTGQPDPLKQACDASVLILDDLGKSCDGKRDLDLFQVLLTTRYNTNKPTIFTTNLNWEQLSSVFEPSIASRMSEMCRGRIFTLRGRDRRISA